VESAAPGGDCQHARAERAPAGMVAEHVLDRGDAVAEAEQLEDLAA
jgi:hypothetical protein